MSIAAKIINAVVYVISLFMAITKTLRIGTAQGQEELPFSKETLGVKHDDTL